jgi:hypothetical protein
MNSSTSHGVKGIEAAAKAIVVALFAIVTFPPLIPLPWGEGLEWSWQMALHESVVRGLVYGREFLFTYGPLGFLAYPRDIGDLLAHGMMWRLLIHGLFCLAIALNVWRCESTTLAGLLCAVIAFSQVRVELPSRMLLAEMAFLVYAFVRGTTWPALLAAALAALGLLMKFNTGLAGATSLLLWAAIMVASGRGRSLLIWSLPIAGLFLAVLLAGFRYYGGPLDALPDYFVGSLRLASGYSAQMAREGSNVAFLLVGVCYGLVAALVVTGSVFDRRYASLGLLLSAVLFVLFKGVYVRTDSTHVYLFFAALPGFVALFLVLPRTRLLRWATAFGCVLVLGVSIYGRGSEFSAPEQSAIAAYTPDGPRNLFDAFYWSERRRGIEQLSRPAIARQRLPEPMLERLGTTPIDAYPQEMSILFANHLNWCPRPVPQSYSAYTPELDEINARHYRSKAGPALILYEQNAIDGQHPWFVDPLTLQEIYKRFDVVVAAPRFLLLARRAEQRPGDSEASPVGKIRLGERVAVPQDDQYLLAAGLRFQLTNGGRARDVLWKVYPPSLRVEFADGSEQTYRIVWRNAINGLLLSELPTNLKDVDALWDTAKRSRVAAFTVLADSADFAKEVELTWLRTAIPAKPAK